ncbi:MAG: glycosyltransferase [Candidatus Eisenbacteria bacterium]|nr:glycosyltransferase [Candidatus Eisenbacteria bacterium]
MGDSQEKLRILHTVPYAPVPPDSGGKLVPYHHATGLARRGHALTLIAPIRRESDEEALRSLSGSVEVRSVSCAAPSRGRIVGRILKSSLSYRVTRHTLPAVARETARLLEGDHFDVVLLDTLFTAYLIPLIRESARKTPVVLVNHNFESLLFRRYLSGRSPFVRAAGLIELARVRRAEKEAAAAADRVLVLSGRDREGLLELSPEARISVLPPGAPVRPGERIPPPERPDTVIFLGNYRWEPNRQAARWLAQEIFPRIRRAAPDAELRLAGEDPDSAIAPLHDPGRGIRVLGHIEDAATTIQGAAIFAVPLRVGGGVRLKILEAMANERPVVSTTLGAEGIPYVSGEHLLEADGEEAIAAGIILLIRDRERAARIARAGRELVEKKFGWDRIVERLEAFLFETVRCN